jgi:Tfp pilus assembly protein PilN
MKTSFIAAREKQLITIEMRWLLGIFVALAVLMAGAYLFFSVKSSGYSQAIAEDRAQVPRLTASILTMEQEMNLIEQEMAESEKIFTGNMVLKEKIKNIFDLVPDGVTLSRVELTQNTLQLEGVADDKMLFAGKLETPLRSIFVTSTTTFEPLRDGTFGFVSISGQKEQK